MGPDTYQLAEEIVSRVLDLPEEERGPYLDRICAADVRLRRDVDTLLAADAAASGFLEQPVMAAPASLPATGEFLGRYRILEELGAGGMGVVFRGERADGQFEKVVAIKFLRTGALGDDGLRRFRSERQILANLEHPNIARLLDGGTTETGWPYIVMEEVQGEPIDACAKRRHLSVEARIDLFSKVCKAVQYAHRCLVVHRDLKPQNILVGDDQEPKLLDFGLASLLREDGDAPIAEGGPFGTWGYSSPEQIAGGLVTTTSDVYSLGVVLYQLLTDSLPFDHPLDTPSPPALARNDVAAPRPSVPPPPSQRVIEGERGSFLRRGGRLPRDLDAIVLRALAVEPEDRYPSVEAFDQDLRCFRQGLPVAARGTARRYMFGRFLRRHALLASVIGLLLVVLMVFSVTTAVHATRLGVERDRAFRALQQSEQVTALLAEVFQASDVEEMVLDQQGETPRTTARDLLDRGAARIRGDDSLNPYVRAELLHTLGVAYRNMGAKRQADDLLTEALRSRKAIEPPVPLAVASSLLALGRLRDQEGKVEESVVLVEQAVALMRSANGDATRLASALSGLGEVLRQRDELSRAEDLQREALSLRRQVFPESSYEVRESLNNLGLVRFDQGQIDDADRLMSLSVRQGTAGLPQGMGAAIWLSNLAVVRGARGRGAEAMDLLETSLGIRRKLLPAGHPSLIMALNNLAAELLRAGALRDARRLLEEAVETGSKSLGSGHPRLAMCRYNLAKIAVEHERYTEAEELLALGMEAFEQAFGPEHSAVLKGHHRLGVIAERQRRYALARQRFRLAAEGRRQVLGDTHPDTAESMWGLGRTLLRLDDPLAAIEPLTHAYQAHHAEDAAEIHSAITSDLVLALGLGGRLDEAERVLWESHDTLAEVESARATQRAAVGRLRNFYAAHPQRQPTDEQRRSLEVDE